MIDEIREIPLSEISVDYSMNSRGKVTPSDVNDLCDSIRKEGLQAPVAVYFKDGKYHLIYGFRRHKAHEVLGCPTIKAIVRPYKSDDDVRVSNLTENLSRKDLNCVQEAKALKYFFDRGWSDTLIGNHFQKSAIWSLSRRSILKIPSELHPFIAIAELGPKALIKLANRPYADQQKMVTAYKDKKFALQDYGIGTRTVSDKKAAGHYNTIRDPERLELEQMQFFLQDVYGVNLTSIVLAWVRGLRSMKEVWTEIKRKVEEDGFEFVPPSDLINELLSEGKENDA